METINGISYYTEDDYKKVPKVDAHMHYSTEHTALLDKAIEDNFRFISINTDVPFYPWPTLAEQNKFCTTLKKQFPNRFYYLTTCPVQNFNTPHFANDALDYIKRTLEAGASGVKFWKNIGMTLKDEQGNYVFLDNPKFDPIFKWLEDNNISTLGHLGEPKNCWLPLEEMTVKQDRDYFADHPEYHMYLHPEDPSHEKQIEARDNRLAKNLNLKFVGAHLGSMEYSVDVIANRLDRFPNMAVDLAERICHLQHQSRFNFEKVRDFFVKYQDRIIYGTDVIVDPTTTDDIAVKEGIHSRWWKHWVYFTQGGTQTAPKVTGDFQGLHLPASIVDKIYFRNAQKWYPSLK